MFNTLGSITPKQLLIMQTLAEGHVQCSHIDDNECDQLNKLGLVKIKKFTLGKFFSSFRAEFFVWTLTWMGRIQLYLYGYRANKSETIYSTRPYDCPTCGTRCHRGL